MSHKTSSKFFFNERWTEEKDNSEFELSCMFKVDEYGFFVYWKSEGREGDVIELCQVSDIRAGGVPKVKKRMMSYLYYCLPVTAQIKRRKY